VVLLAVTGLGYVVDTMAAVLSEGLPFTLSTVTFVGELLLAVWLVARSSRCPTTLIARRHPHSGEARDIAGLSTGPAWASRTAVAGSRVARLPGPECIAPDRVGLRTFRVRVTTVRARPPGG